MSKVDRDADCIAIDDKDIVRVDGLPAFRLVMKDGEPFVQFCDRRPEHIARRGGTRFLDVGFDALMAKLLKRIERLTRTQGRGIIR